MSTNTEMREEVSSLSEMLGGDAVDTSDMDGKALRATVIRLRGLVEAPPADETPSTDDAAASQRDADARAALVADASRIEKDRADADRDLRAAAVVSQRKAEAMYRDRAADEAKQREADAEAARVAAAERMIVNGAGNKIEGGPPVDPPREPAPRLQRYPYQVAEGRSLSCATGIKGPGEEVTLKDLMKGGGAENADYAKQNLDRLVAIRCISKR